MTEIKICGINSESAFDAVVEAEAEYLGFVFFDKSPRFVTPAQASALSRRYEAGPRRVGLFVNPTADTVRAALDVVQLDIFQIYGSVELCRQLHEVARKPIWRALGIVAADDLPTETDGIDGFVIEAKPPPEATRPGGNAITLNWHLLNNWQPSTSWLLGGGLRPDNVGRAIAIANPSGVDVSSGVEVAPGTKSPALIRNFVAAVRAAATLGA
jgi:phosphoribosylanthranilate isomerase